MEALSSIGQKLRQHYAEQMTAPLPEHLQALLRQLASAERQSNN
jgi:Anti-sigma factor NepR